MTDRGWLIRRPVHSSHQFFWWSHQPSHQFQITDFSVSSHQNVLYNSVAINISNPQSQLNYTAHFDDLKQKNWWFELVIWLVTSPKNWWLEWTARLTSVEKLPPLKKERKSCYNQYISPDTDISLVHNVVSRVYQHPLATLIVQNFCLMRASRSPGGKLIWLMTFPRHHIPQPRVYEIISWNYIHMDICIFDLKIMPKSFPVSNLIGKFLQRGVVHRDLVIWKKIAKCQHSRFKYGTSFGW